VSAFDGQDQVHLDGTEPLPEKVSGFYQRLLSRSGISTLSLVLPHTLCLIAVAKEPLTQEQLIDRQHCPVWPILDEKDSSCSAERFVEQGLSSLSSMVKSERNDGFDIVYTLYHHTLREYLRSSDSLQYTFRAALRWIIDIVCRSSPRDWGSFEGYVVRQGVSHLLETDRFLHVYETELMRATHVLETGQLASAIKLVWHLSGRNTKVARKFGLEPAAIQIFTREIGIVLDLIVHALDKNSLDSDALRQIEGSLCALPARQLAQIFQNLYETGAIVSALRVLIQFLPKSWPAYRSRFISGEDLVAKQSISEAEADVYRTYERGQSNLATMMMKSLSDRLDDPLLDEQEIAGYALRFIYTRNPGAISNQVLLSWADGKTWVHRSILGEVLVTLALQCQFRDLTGQLLNRLDGTRMFSIPWEYQIIDLRESIVLCGEHVAPAVRKKISDEQLEYANQSILLMFYNTWELQGLLVQHDGIIKTAGDRLIEDFATAGQTTRTNVISTFLDAIRNLAPESRIDLARAVFRLLLSHPLWAVAESGATMFLDLCRTDTKYFGLVDEFLDTESELDFKPGDPSWRFHYGVLDASFGVRLLDQGERFDKALWRFYKHPVSRVRGVCLDDFSALVREAKSLRERRKIVCKYKKVWMYWLEHATDCWELEYLHTLFHYLEATGAPEYIRLSSVKLSHFLEADFQEKDRYSFLQSIDGIACTLSST